MQPTANFLPMEVIPELYWKLHSICEEQMKEFELEIVISNTNKKDPNIYFFSLHRQIC